MKKIFIFLLSLSLTGITLSQGKFSASFSNTGNVLTFKLKPDVTTSTGFSTLEFFVRYPDPSPAFTYGLVTVNTTSFPGMVGNGNIGGGAVGSGAWEIERDNSAYSIPGYHVDHFIFTAPAVATTVSSYTGGTSYDVISVALRGVPPSTVDLRFVADDFEATSYLAITDQNGGDLRPAAITNYFFPTTLSTPGPSGSTIYYQELLSVPLPVKFLGFDVSRKNNTAIINWSVENETALTDKYIIESSANSTDFTPVATIAASNNGRGSNSYNFIQDNLSAIRNSGVIYYRVKQVDKDGKFVYTPIKTIRLDGKAFAVNAYPNPVKSSTKLTIDLLDDSKVLISITDAAGKQVKTIQLQGFKGPNIKDVNLSNLSNGNYMLKVQSGTEVKSLPLVKVN